MTNSEDLAEVVRRYVADHHPELRAVVLSISSPKNGRPPYLSLVVKTGRAAGLRPGRPHVSRPDRDVLKAVAGCPEDAPTGVEIAGILRIPEDKQPELRKRLSSLRKRGLLGGKERDQGYPLTDLGFAALDE